MQNALQDLRLSYFYLFIYLFIFTFFLNTRRCRLVFLTSRAHLHVHQCGSSFQWNARVDEKH